MCNHSAKQTMGLLIVQRAKGHTKHISERNQNEKEYGINWPPNNKAKDTINTPPPD